MVKMHMEGGKNVSRAIESGYVWKGAGVILPFDVGNSADIMGLFYIEETQK